MLGLITTTILEIRQLKNTNKGLTLVVDKLLRIIDIYNLSTAFFVLERVLKNNEPIMRIYCTVHQQLKCRWSKIFINNTCMKVQC
jgi:hypothetical protein